MATNMNVSLYYGTNLPPLIQAMSKTTGDVLEMGMGVFSTPYLHYQCILSNRLLVSYENYQEWMNFFLKYHYPCKNHEINFVEKYSDAKIDKPWDIVLIDQTPDSSRIEEVKRLANLAKYIIIHDSNDSNERNYHYSEIYPLFKYRTDWDADKNHATVLSNLVDLTHFWDMDTFNHVMAKFGLNYNTEFPIRLKFKRYDMAKMFCDLGFKVGAEIGVDQGHYSEVLCLQNPNLKLYCIDPWKAYGDYKDITLQEELDKNCLTTIERLKPYNCEVIRQTSMEAVQNFKPESLDFVYIDGNHEYEYVKQDIEEWAKIVRPGGIVSGHDYGHFKHKDRNLGSKKAIDEYVQEHNRKLFLVNRNFQTTWFFIK